MSDRPPGLYPEPNVRTRLAKDRHFCKWVIRHAPGPSIIGKRDGLEFLGPFWSGTKYRIWSRTRMALPCFPASVVREPTAKGGYRLAFFDVEWVRERISWTSRRSVFGLRFSAAAVFLVVASTSTKEGRRVSLCFFRCAARPIPLDPVVFPASGRVAIC